MFCYTGDSTDYPKRVMLSSVAGGTVVVASTVAWLKTFIKDLGQHQPNQDSIMLPNMITRGDMWDMYIDDVDGDCGDRSVSLSYFRQILRENFPRCKFPKWHTFHKCSLCYDIDLAKKDSEVKKDQATKAALNELYHEHLKQCKAERDKFYGHNKKSNPKASAAHSWRYVSAIIDGMTQSATACPRFPRKPAWMENLEVLDVHCMGSLISGVGAFMDFQYKNFRNDANALLHTVHLTVLRTQEDRRAKGLAFPEVFYLQLDNVGTNKNHHLIAYASYLVLTGVFKKIKIGFLIAGHTHENIDQMFSRFSIRLRRKECLSVPELVKVAEECFTPNPKCYLTTEIADIASWLDGHKYEHIQNKMRDINYSHQFKIYKDNISGKVLVQCKQLSTDASWDPVPGVEVLKDVPATERPDRLQRLSLVPHTTRSQRTKEKQDAKEQRKRLRTERTTTTTQGAGEAGPRVDQDEPATGDVSGRGNVRRRSKETAEEQVARQKKDHEEALSNLRKTVDLMASKHMSAWTASRKDWCSSDLLVGFGTRDMT